VQFKHYYWSLFFDR